MERLRGWADRVRALFTPPEREVKSWIVDESPPPRVEAVESSMWVYVEGFKAFWIRARTRLFRAAAGLLAIVDLGLGILLYSNVWYLNLMLYAVIVPHILILIHYLRLTRSNVK